MKPSVHLQFGLQDAHREQAAALCYAAFRRKLSPLLAPERQAIPALADSLEPSRTIVALEGERLVGVLGFQRDQRRFINPAFHAFFKQFGVIGGSLRALALGLFGGNAWQPGSFLVDAVAIHHQVRGQGLGTRLLKAAFETARAYRLDIVRLEVVDTNPKARALYERLGFREEGTERYLFLRRVAGFSNVSLMRKEVV
jgi:ribosomal protein S18 acetylase RimI-like enzyme